MTVPEFDDNQYARGQPMDRETLETLSDFYSFRPGCIDESVSEQNSDTDGRIYKGGVIEAWESLLETMRRCTK